MAFERRHLGLARLVGLSVGSLALLTLLSAGCRDDFDPSRCDAVITRCRTVCDYWCDSWGCYPTCWDQCWNECLIVDHPPQDDAPPDASSDAAPPVLDSGVEHDGGVLCAPCTSNDQCQTGALCILRGGAPDAAADASPATPSAFCGQSCFGAPDCPAGFSCTQIGASKQCLPTASGCPR